MRRILLTFSIVLILVSCKKLTNNPDDILKASWIRIDISGIGCFGSWDQTLEIIDSEDQKILFKDESEIREIILSPEKRELVAELIRTGMAGGYDGTSICTNLTEYKIQTQDFKTQFLDNSCGADEIFQEIITS